MTPRLITTMVCLLLAEIGIARAADTDPVLAKLDQAKAAYATARDQYRDGVGKFFDKREDAARAQGNKKLVDQIKAEREVFKQKGELPPTAPVELKRKLATSRSVLEQAYSAAVRDYTKARKDVEATAVEKELEEFKLGAESTWIALFNGKDTKGWRPSDGTKANWRVENGSLLGTGEFGYLVTDRDDFDNFRLRIEVMIEAGGDSGVCFRVQDKQVKFAYEGQVGAKNTGSLVQFNGAGKTEDLAVTPTPTQTGVWYTLEVVAEGSRLTLLVDGKETARVDDSKKTYSRGAIALQHLGAKGAVHFRKVEIQELPAK